MKESVDGIQEKNVDLDIFENFQNSLSDFSS